MTPGEDSLTGVVIENLFFSFGRFLFDVDGYFSEACLGGLAEESDSLAKSTSFLRL